MSSFRLRRNLHFWLDGREYVIEERLGNGDLKIRDCLTEEASSICEDAILKLYEEDRFQAEPPEPRSGSKKVKSYKAADFSQIDDSLKEEARRRYRYVKAYFEKNLQKRNHETLEPIIEEVSKELREELLAGLTRASEELKQEILAKLEAFDSPSWISVYRWINKYQTGGSDVRSLVSNHRAKGDYKPKISQEVIDIIDDAVNEVYLNPLKPTISDVCDSIGYRITAENAVREKQNLPPLECPHPTTIYQRVSKIEAYQETLKRYGRKTADRENNFSGHEPPQAKRPLEVVEIDHTKLPFYIIDGETKLPIGVPTLTSAIDKAFNIPVGYYLSFEPPSSLSVMQCLWHAIHPKNYVKKKYPSITNSWDAYGKPGLLKCDNALEFKEARQLKDSALQLGFPVDFCPVKVPWYKSRVEGHFRKLNSQALGGKPGSYLKFEKEFDCEYDPAKNAVITLEDLHEIIHIFIVDVVCQEPHPKFGTPKAEAWRKAIDEFPPVLPSSRRDLRIFLGTVVERVISRNGVEFEGLYYRSDDLILLRQIYEQRDRRRTGGTRDREKAKIKIDPTDISCVYVYNPTSDEFVRIPAVNQSYTKGLSLWQHRKIKELAARESEKVDITALILAKAKIQEVVDRAWQNVKGGRTRSTAARWLGIGRDGIDVGGVENYHNQQVAKRQVNSTSTNFAPTIDCEVNDTFNEDMPVGESTSVESISNFESAFDESFSTEIANSELNSFINPAGLDAQNQLTQNSLQEEQLENSTVTQQNPTELLKPSGKRVKQSSGSTATEKKTSDKKPRSKKSSVASNSQNKQKRGEKQKVEDEPKQNPAVTKLDLTGWGADYRLPQ